MNIAATLLKLATMNESIISSNAGDGPPQNVPPPGTPNPSLEALKVVENPSRFDQPENRRREKHDAASWLKAGKADQ